MDAVRRGRYVARVILCLLIPACGSHAAAAASRDQVLSEVRPNDNQHAAGAVEHGTLTLALRAGAGRWQPEGPAGPALEIEAFGEVGKPLTVPAPLIRVAEGTEIVASIRNELEAPLVVHGLCARDGTPCAPLEVPPGQTARGAVQERSGRHLPLLGVDGRRAGALSASWPGRFVVDPSAGPVEPDRVLVITEWTNLTADAAA